MAQVIEPPRIGPGRGYAVAGWLLVVGGIVLCLFGAVLVGGPMIGLAIACFALRFWVGLFHVLETRMITIQVAMADA